LFNYAFADSKEVGVNEPVNSFITGGVGFGTFVVEGLVLLLLVGGQDHAFLKGFHDIDKDIGVFGNAFFLLLQSVEEWHFLLLFTQFHIETIGEVDTHLLFSEHNREYDLVTHVDGDAFGVIDFFVGPELELQLARVGGLVFTWSLYLHTVGAVYTLDGSILFLLGLHAAGVEVDELTLGTQNASLVKKFDLGRHRLGWREDIEEMDLLVHFGTGTGKVDGRLLAVGGANLGPGVGIEVSPEFLGFFFRCLRRLFGFLLSKFHFSSVSFFTSPFMGIMNFDNNLIIQIVLVLRGERVHFVDQ
jgi:hypothetical protein